MKESKAPAVGRTPFQKWLDKYQGILYLIPWIIGFVVCRIVVANQAVIPVPSSIMGMATGFVVYIILAKLLDRKKDTDERFVIEEK